MSIRAALLIFLLFLFQTPFGAAQQGDGGPGYEVVGRTFAALQVADDQASAEWYGRVLRLEEIKHLKADDGRFSIRILQGSGLTVELIRSNAATEAPGTHRGIFKVGFYVDDIDSAFAWLKSQGVQTDQRIMVDDAVGVSTFVFRDPDGNRLQVFERLER